MRIQERNGKNGKTHYYASVVRTQRDDHGKVVQKKVAYIGKVEKEQIPYLKAAFAKKKPKLVYEDGIEYP